MAVNSITSEKQPVLRTVQEMLGYDGEHNAVLLSLAQAESINSQTSCKAKPDLCLIACAWIYARCIFYRLGMVYEYIHQKTGTRMFGAQTVKKPPAVQETQVQSLDQEDPLEKGIATYSNILAWRIPWTESLADYSPGHKESDMTEWLLVITNN